MICTNKIKTSGDKLMFTLCSNKTAMDLGYDIKQVSGGCKRYIALTTDNAVAAVAWYSLIGMYTYNNNLMIDFYNIRKSLQDFFAGDLDWSDFVRCLWCVQGNMGVTNDFFDEILTHFEGMAYEIRTYLPANPFENILKF